MFINVSSAPTKVMSYIFIFIFLWFFIVDSSIVVTTKGGCRET